MLEKVLLIQGGASHAVLRHLLAQSQQVSTVCSYCTYQQLRTRSSFNLLTQTSYGKWRSFQSGSFLSKKEEDTEKSPNPPMNVPVKSSEVVPEEIPLSKKDRVDPSKIPLSVPFKDRGGPRNEIIDESTQVPIELTRFSTHPANSLVLQMKAADAEEERHYNIRAYTLTVSIAAFIFYWCFYRERNDLDEAFENPRAVFVKFPEVEEPMLREYIASMKAHRKGDPSALEERLRVLVKERKEREKALDIVKEDQERRKQLYQENKARIKENKDVEEVVDEVVAVKN